MLCRRCIVILRVERINAYRSQDDIVLFIYLNGVIAVKTVKLINRDRVRHFYMNRPLEGIGSLIVQNKIISAQIFRKAVHRFFYISCKLRFGTLAENF